MKRVLLVAPLPPPYGGISHWAAMVSRYSRKPENTTLHVIDTAVRYRSLFEKSFARRVILGVPSLIRQLYRVVSELIKGNVLAIHITTSGVYAPVRDIAIIQIARIFRRPSILHIRSGRIPALLAKRGLRSRCLKIALSRASTVIAIDDKTELTIRSVVPEAAVIKIPNCIDLSVLPRLSSEKQKTVLFVGLVIPEKGIEDLLESWSRIQYSDWRLLIVGAFSADYMKVLQDTRDLHGVEFVGELDNSTVLEKLAGAAVFCLPSHTEGFPNVVLEAMALGSAIIATSVGAIPEMLSGDAGLVVDAQDPVALATQLEFLIENSETRRKLGSHAVEKVKNEYELGQVYKAYEAVWRGSSPG